MSAAFVVVFGSGNSARTLRSRHSTRYWTFGLQPFLASPSSMFHEFWGLQIAGGTQRLREMKHPESEAPSNSEKYGACLSALQRGVGFLFIDSRLRGLQAN